MKSSEKQTTIEAGRLFFKNVQLESSLNQARKINADLAAKLEKASEENQKWRTLFSSIQQVIINQTQK